MPYIIERQNIICSESTDYTNNPKYPMTDLCSVFTHYSYELNKNVQTENKINGGANNGKSGK